MALCIGLDGVGFTRYNDSRKTNIPSGKSHVCFKQISLDRRSSERLLRRLVCDLGFSGEARACASC